jgi:hypothetical protein
MPEIGMSGLMSGDRKRSVAIWPKPPRLSSTLRKFLHLAAGAAALPVLSRFAWAQAYPTRPVRIVVSAPPGSNFDLLARLIAQWLSERLGQPFIVDHRPGGGTNIGTEAVVRAPADGYTLLVVGPSGRDQCDPLPVGCSISEMPSIG